MKQIILISRIHPYRNQEEFSKYSDGDQPVLKETEELRLLILKGSNLNQYTKNSEQADAILKVATDFNLDVGEDTVIAYHYSNNIDRAILLKFKGAGWTNINIKQYSTGGNEETEPVYQILNPLGAAIKPDQGTNQADQNTAARIEELWRFFSHNPVVEAKHKLLQMVIAGEIPTAVAKEIKEYQEAVNTFATETKGKDIISNEYKEAFTKLLNALGLEK